MRLFLFTYLFFPIPYVASDLFKYPTIQHYTFTRSTGNLTLRPIKLSISFTFDLPQIKAKKASNSKSHLLTFILAGQCEHARTRPNNIENYGHTLWLNPGLYSLSSQLVYPPNTALLAWPTIVSINHGLGVYHSYMYPEPPTAGLRFLDGGIM